MKAFDGYKRYIEWDRLATAQEWQPQWAEDIGLAVGHYLNECIMFGKTPAFNGFFEHLEKIAPKKPAQSGESVMGQPHSGKE